MRSLPWALLLLFSLPLTLACRTDDDCSLLGVCDPLVGKCICDAGWKGADCGVLNLLPARYGNGYNRTSENISSWCGSIVYDQPGDVYYMFVSEFTMNCPLDNWNPNSHVIRTYSKGNPFGPYIFDEEILPSFHHNPTVVQAPDGHYLMYAIGLNVSEVDDCTEGQTPPGIGGWPNESGLSLWTATSITGEWKAQGYVLKNDTFGKWDRDTTNPGPYVLPNGTVMLMYRGCPEECDGEELIGMSRAESWQGPYTRFSHTHPLFPNPNEDPFLWQDTRGNFHALFHSLEDGGGFGGPNIGRHAWSPDGFQWTFGNKTLAFNTTVHFEDGQIVDFYRRERPQLFFKPGSPVKQPILLITGVQEFGKDSSYTFLQPVGP